MKITSLSLATIGFLMLCIGSNNVSAQAVLKVGSNLNSIQSNAVLELESTTKGFLLPRMTAIQMAAITTPAEGMMIYCTDCGAGEDGELRIAYNSVWQTFKGNLTGNITGNAATVTTNSDLTGPITSSGNATSVASQTGTGSKFVMDTAPTLITPVLGVATATSVNGTTIPSSKTLVVTTDKLNVLAATTSAELAGVISDETGTGSVVLSASPALTGTPTAPTAGAGTNTTQLATTAFVATAISNTPFKTTSGVTSNSNGATATDDFVFGSTTLNDNTLGTLATDDDSRMYFDKSKAAFRAGTVSGTQWDVANVGSYSTAFGENTKSSGNHSTASGNNTTASGPYSTAMGTNTSASGSASTTMGSYTYASGYTSIAMGYMTAAKSFAETAIGTYNTSYTPLETTTFNAADRLFVIGNGTSTTASDALVMLKNGNTTLKGTLTLTNGTSSYTLPNADGTANQVLKTNGSGALTWSTPSTTATAYSGILPVANGGTGSSTQNFVDLTTDQTVAGAKTFSLDAVINTVTLGKGNGSNNYSNTAIGYQVLKNNTTGDDNTAAGYAALQGNTTGANNTALGMNALSQNVSGNNNVGLGFYSLYQNSTGGQNTAVGFESLKLSTSNYNSALGYSALVNVSSGSNNTGIGNLAGQIITSGTNNTFLGQGSNANLATRTNSTAIGYGAIVNADNAIQLGNTSVTNVKTSGTVTAGVVTYPNTDGTSGQVLTTNGTGTASWTTPTTTATAYSGILPVANGGTGVNTSTGTGSVVLSNTPTLVTPVLGAASASSIAFAGSTSGTTTLVANAIAGNSTIALPNDGTLATIEGTEALTNKTINGITPIAGIEGFTLTGGTSSKTLTVSNNATVSGINSGDQTITLTGDVTGSGTGSFSTTLSNSGVTAATYGSATSVPVFAVDAKGRVTSVTNTTISGTSPIGSSLTSGKIIVGDGSNLAAAVSMSGDVTINNAGVTTIGAGKVSNAMLAGSIDLTTKVTGVLPITNGGTGASTAAGARTNLGLGTAAVLNTGTASGNIPVLDGTGKIPNSLINVSGLTYKGSISLSGNPSVPNETAGNYYIVSIAGIESSTGLTFGVGDWMIASTSGATTTWQKISQTSTVSSVAGKTGVVTLATSDLTDVDLAGNATGKVLTWNGTKWAPANVSAGTITNVTAASPLVSSGGATPQISMPVATTSNNGYLSSTDWTTFNNKASVASPTFTGTPAAPTALAGTNTTQIATTAFVTAAVSGSSVRDVTDEFTATVSQTVFTLTQTKSANSKVKMYINGVRISNTAYSVTGITLTYLPANNLAYTLTAGDRIQFDYFY